MSLAAYAGLALLTLVALVVWLLARDDRAVRWAGGLADRLSARVRLLRPPAEGYAVRAAAFRRDSAALAVARLYGLDPQEQEQVRERLPEEPGD